MALSPWLLEDMLVNVIKGIKRLALVGVISITPGAKVSSKEFLLFRDVVLSNHISTGVLAGVGLTVLMELKARPRSPSPTPEANSGESLLASSMVWLLLSKPPTLKLSIATVPDAEDLSL